MAPAPPSSFGVVSLTSSTPSEETARPSRPPVALADARYRTCLIDMMISFSVSVSDLQHKSIGNYLIVCYLLLKNMWPVLLLSCEFLSVFYLLPAVWCCLRRQ